ncbi:MAG TPA: ABC transporter ATP-binding protein, partial [Phycisphaerales bacterium]|nr:ABC transporter ATP-binding protein [Phycisphaerales bacterium]
MTSAPTISPAAAASADARTPIVAAQQLTKIFKDFWLRDRARAVDGIDFEIYRGEIFGLLGPNGSGKSTTIKLILGLLRKSRGRLAVFGRAPTDVAIKKRIGYLPEDSHLYPFLNARETLDYYARLFQLPSQIRERRIDELLDMVGLAGVQHRQIREYSKGMQRRIGIAQALINDPEFLILDEPTTGLDPLGTRQIKDLIIALGKRGKTILLSSHMLADVEDCVDRMVILYGGKIRKEGTCDQLLSAEDRSIIETDP